MEQKGRGNQQLSTVKETYCPEICLWWWSSPMEGNLRLRVREDFQKQMDLQRNHVGHRQVFIGEGRTANRAIRRSVPVLERTEQCDQFVHCFAPLRIRSAISYVINGHLSNEQTSDESWTRSIHL